MTISSTVACRWLHWQFNTYSKGGKHVDYTFVKSQFADWATRDDIKNQLNMDLTVLLYQNGYPPEWDEEVFEKVMEQAENFRKLQ